jgi:HSP20 family protein
MRKILPIIALLASTLVSAHGPFQSGFFNQGFNDGFWRDFDRQFQKLDHKINRLQYSTNRFNSQSRQYFDKDSNSYVIEVKLSGLGKKDIDISAHKNMLVIKGMHHSETTSDNQSTKSSTSFSHAISIPRDGDKDNISADFKDGVLKVSIPKLDKPRPQVQKISIN